MNARTRASRNRSDCSEELRFRDTRPLRLLAGATLVGLLGCGSEPRPRQSPPLSTVNVKVHQAEAQGLLGTEEVVGTVRAKVRATLEAKVRGRISRLYVDVGDRVKTGQLIAELDADEIRARVTQSDAVLGQAETEVRRYRSLYQKNAVTQAELEQVEARYAVAEARAKEARSILAYARVQAPFAGVVTHKLANAGDLASPGRPLVEIEDPSTLRLEVAVPEALSGFVALGAVLTVRIAALEGEHAAVISEVAATADPNSRTLAVKADLPALKGLRSGQFGRALIPTGRTQVLRLPKTAVVRRGQLELVFVVRDRTAHLRLVKSGKHFGDQVEVVSGIESGEQVVIEGAETLVDEQPVEVAR